MRELVETFRLPGEAQQISRITEVFASIYFASGPGIAGLVSDFVWSDFPSLSEEIKSEDAVYVLAYSVILLNTDLHNPQIRVSCFLLMSYSKSPSYSNHHPETNVNRGLPKEPEGG